MSRARAAERHRSRAHQHALERLRERHDPEATHEDVISLRDMARAAYRAGDGLNRPGDDGVRIGLQWRGEFIQVIYAPRHDALRTVAPNETTQPEATATRGE